MKKKIITLMSERERRILYLIIDYHLNHGSSVGSRTLVKEYSLELSPATVRNVMSDLEYIGYIEKSFSSSGRFPTSKGYKYYIDFLLKVRKMSEQKLAKIRQYYKGDDVEVTALLENSASILTEFSKYVGVAMEPYSEESVVSNLKLVCLSKRQLLIAIVINNNNVKTKRIITPIDIDDEIIFEISEYLNSRVIGKSFNVFLDEIRNIHFSKVKLFSNFTMDIEPNIHIMEGKYKNSINVLNIKDNLQNFLLNLINDENFNKDKVNIFIDNEKNFPFLKDLTLVCSTYTKGNSRGIVGVVGPKRMKYDEVVSLVESVTSEIQNKLNKEALCDKEKNKKK